MKKSIFTLLFVVMSVGLSQGLLAQVQHDFDVAYQQYPNVPRGSLEAMAYGATRMYNLVPDMGESSHHGPHRYGIFALVADGEGYWDNNLCEVLEIEAHASAEVKAAKFETFLQSPQTQILAVAKRMSFLCEKYHVSGHANMAAAIKDFSEIPANSMLNTYAQELYAYEVFYQLKQGVNTMGIVQKPIALEVGDWFDTEVYRILSAPTVYIDGEKISNGSAVYKLNGNDGGGMNTYTTDYGPALWVSSPNFSSRSGTAISAVTIHDTEGSYSGSISWFQNPGSQVSAHYVLRSSDGQITQMVLESNKAWHVGSENPYTIGLEHEGYAAQAGWYTTAMYNASAALVRDICTDYGINPTTCYNGPSGSTVNVLSSTIKIKGHQHFPNNSHTDPGINWDWAGYYNLVNQIGVTCNQPMALTAGNLTPNSGRLSWTAVAGASSYSVHYKVSGGATWTTLSVSTAGAFLTSLAANTGYEWEVATVCGANTSAYIGGGIFTTMASSSTACAGNITDSGGGSANYSNSENWTYTIVPTSATGVSLTFNSFGLEANYDYLYIYDGTSIAAPLIGTYTGTTSPGTVNSTGGALTLKFTSDGATVSWGFTANWTCTQILCNTPSGMASSGITGTTANLAWTAIAGVSAYTVQVKPASGSVWTSYLANTNSYALSGLSASTAYNWHVKANCSPSTSSGFGAAQSFTTAAPCTAPTGISASLVSTTTATISWGAVAGSVGYIVEWKTAASSIWSVANPSSPSYALAGLLASTAYQYRVRNKCSSTVNSGYSTTGTFTTQASCYDAWEANNSSGTASTLSSGMAKYGKICTSTSDVDWFKVTTSVTSSITVNLSQLPKNYNMELYVGGSFVVGSYNSGTTSETITRTSQPAGSFYYRVYGATNTDYDASLDYQILATVTPAIATSLEETPLPLDVILSPNPVNDVFELVVENRAELRTVNICIVNMAGVSVFEKIVSVDKPLRVSTMGWAEGMYMVVLQDGAERVCKRFIVGRD